MPAKGLVYKESQDIAVLNTETNIIFNYLLDMTRASGFTLAVWLHSSAASLSANYNIRLTKVIDSMEEDGKSPSVVFNQLYPLANLVGTDNKFIVITSNDLVGSYFDSLKIEIHNEDSANNIDTTISYSIQILTEGLQYV